MTENNRITPALAWSLADQLGHAYALVLALAQEKVADEPLTVTELVALVVLLSFPDGLSQTAWGKYQGVSRQRAHKISGKLEAGKLISLKRHGRSSTAKLTPAGRRIIKRIEPRLSKAYAKQFEGLSPREANELARLLSKMLKHP